MISAAIVAHSSLIRAGLKAALEDGGARVTATAESLDDLPAASHTDCDVIVFDLPPEGASKEQASLVQGRPLVLLVDADDIDARAWLADGVSLLDRSADGPTIAAAVMAAAAGLVAAPPPLIEYALRQGASRDAAAAELHADLTARELEVLRQLAAGSDNRAIAAALRISPHTAKFHVGQIIAKLGASSRTEAVAKAFRAGLVAAEAD